MLTMNGLGAATYTPGSCACDQSLTGDAWDACQAALSADSSCKFNINAATPTSSTGIQSTAKPWYTTWYGVTGILVVGGLASIFLFGGGFGSGEHELRGSRRRRR